MILIKGASDTLLWHALFNEHVVAGGSILFLFDRF